MTALLITAAVVYFVFVLPISSARRLDRTRRGLPAEDETPISEDIILLTEIRDALIARPGNAARPDGTSPQV